MKKFLSILTATMFLMTATACEGSNSHGECVGLFEERNPNATYKVSIWNLVVGAIFSPLIIVPVYIGLEEVWCPTGTHEASPVNVVIPAVPAPAPQK